MWLNTNTVPETIIREPQAITVGNVNHPAAIFTKWSEEELNAIGIYTFLVDAQPPASPYKSYERVTDTAQRPPRVTWVETELDVASLKAKMLKKVDNHAKMLLDSVTSKYSAAEMASWESLETEAQAVVDSAGAAVGKKLQKQIDNSGETALDRANKVLTKATEFNNLLGMVVGTRTVKEAEIEAMTTLAEIQAYENTTVQVPSELDPQVMEDRVVDMCTYGWGA